MFAKPIFTSNVILCKMLVKPFLWAEQIYLQIVRETILKNMTNLCANRSQNHYERYEFCVQIIKKTFLQTVFFLCKLLLNHYVKKNYLQIICKTILKSRTNHFTNTLEHYEQTEFLCK